MSGEDYDIQLELKERLNYVKLLETSALNQKEVIKSDNFQLSKLQIMILDDLFDIPYSWYDPQFQKDIGEVITRKMVKNIEKFGNTPLSKEYMIEHDIPLEKEIVEVDYFKLKLAMRNLLDRLNMLIRKDKIEMSTGRNLDIESLDDIIDKWEEQEEKDDGIIEI